MSNRNSDTSILPGVQAARDDNRTLYIPGAIALLLGLIGIAQVMEVVPTVGIYEVLIARPWGAVLMCAIGLLGMYAVYLMSLIKDSELADRRAEVERKERQNLRDARQVLEKRRLSFRLDEFPSEYEGEPKQGQTEDGWIVYAGPNRSDDVYVVTKGEEDEPELVQAGPDIREKIKQELEEERVSWVGKAETAKTA